MKVLRDDHQACIKRFSFSILVQNPELVEFLAPLTFLCQPNLYSTHHGGFPVYRYISTDKTDCRPIILLDVTAWTYQLQLAIYRDTQRPVH